MIEFGKTLRDAREAKGYSISQLADATHILPQIIENLEREDFSKIVAPIYGRGFVKLYCETVGIESKPLVDEFMAIYNGERPPVIRMKEQAPEIETSAVAEEPAPISSEPQPVQSSVPEISSTHEPVSCDLPLDEPPPIVDTPLSHPMSEPDPIPSMPMPEPEERPSYDDKPLRKRDYRMPGYSMPEVPRRFWRFGLLICVTVAILVLIFFGCRTLYRATMRTPVDTPAAKPTPTQAQENTTDTAAAAKTPEVLPSKTPRKPIAVPPLYID